MDPNDARRIVELYEAHSTAQLLVLISYFFVQALILAGNEEAIWRWHVMETNLMEEEPAPCHTALSPPRLPPVCHATLMQDEEEMFDPHKIGYSATGALLTSCLGCSGGTLLKCCAGQGSYWKASCRQHSLWPFSRPDSSSGALHITQHPCHWHT